MKTSVSRAERLLQEESIILTHPGIKRTELAGRLGVHRSTIGRDIDEISVLYPLTENEEGGLYFPEGFSLDSITFSSFEAVYVYLACKLMADTLDRHSPFAASAMRKLGIAIEKVSPPLSKIMKQDADKLDGRKQILDRTFLAALEGLTIGWMKHEMVRIKYNSPSHGSVHVYDVGIARILPNRLGGTFVVLTFQTDENKMRLFRIDRIKSVVSLNKNFIIPDTIEVEKKLNEAFSIWFKDAPPTMVRLKFSSDTAKRVKETQWHTSQQITDLENGEILVKFLISEPEEMYPWIRGWGKDVEILEPEYLRQRYIDEIREMAERYGI